MAAALAAAIFEREGIEIAVSSAGVFASSGAGASKNAVLAMEHENLNLREHKSRVTATEILENAVLVLTMTRSHLSHVKAAGPAANAFTLGEYAGDCADVADPFGGDLEEYKACAAQIKKLLEACVEKFRAEQHR